jgi:hypothetical protein
MLKIARDVAGRRHSCECSRGASKSGFTIILLPYFTLIVSNA